MKFFQLKKYFCLISAILISFSCISCSSSNKEAAAVSKTSAQPDTQAASDSSDTISETDENSGADAIVPNVEAIEATHFDLPEEAEEASIYVEPIPDISDDFIRGMDASAVLANENSGVVYYNEAGEEQDVFKTLAEAGINYIRIRVWNDPYDENGNGYGGGNNDVATAIALGKRATMYGMKVCIDFHYSDFWADPGKQMCPKAWEGMNIEEKEKALYEFTKESLIEILNAGVNVGMVQVGNETNNGMSGETSPENTAILMSAGSRAIREVSDAYGQDIQVVLHYTNASDYDGINNILQKLQNNGVDYDIFALSYYPYWHGTFENLQNVMANIRDNYGKETLIAETSYCYTLEDGDCNGNSIGEADLIEGYTASVQSQATALRDVCNLANEAKALGVFYWEGTWIPVGNSLTENQKLWETYGSGWASSYASAYDPKDAGKYYGGCAWDNQALFDFEGHPLASLNTFKYLKYGTITEPAIDFVPNMAVNCNVGSDIAMPESVNVIYNDRSLNTELPVTWDEDQLSAIDTSVAGEYVIDGTLEDGQALTCSLTIDMLNYVANPGFEDNDTSMWSITYEGSSNPTDFQEKEADAHDGAYAFHFWSESDMEFAIEQTVTDLPNGTYKLSVYAQGGDMNDTSSLELYAVVNGEELSAPFMLDGYANWQTPEIDGISVTDGTLTIGVRMKCNAKSWGTVDDFTLNLMQ